MIRVVAVADPAERAEIKEFYNNSVIYAYLCIFLYIQRLHSPITALTECYYIYER